MKSQKIYRAIASLLSKNYKNIIIYPFGNQGRNCKKILNEGFAITEMAIIDDYLCQFNPKIRSVEYLKRINPSDVAILIASSSEMLTKEIKSKIKKYFPIDHCASILNGGDKKYIHKSKFGTLCGKYSSGPLCDHPYVERVGSFCSFSRGVDVVLNHSLEYISTAPFLFYRREYSEMAYENYDDNAYKSWYFSGVKPHGYVNKYRKSIIGNDVWLGKNVTICNGSYIGNGVIAGAGAIITKDVPDYAVVVGCPARIIRYRYNQEQINALNIIAWWNWPDDKIRACYEDFYDDIEVFIQKHRNDRKLNDRSIG